jgi:hypothetical protein
VESNKLKLTFFGGRETLLLTPSNFLCPSSFVDTALALPLSSGSTQGVAGREEDRVKRFLSCIEF